MKAVRNTRTHRRCPECQGAGEVTVNRSGFYGTGRQDPQCDEPAPCPAPACVGGWIRTAPLDPLERLKQARQHARCSWGAQRYGELLQRAVSPVNLPRDVQPQPMRWAA